MSSPGGFSLIEVLVAAAILAIAGTVAGMGLLAAWRAYDRAVRTGAGAACAAEAFEAFDRDLHGALAADGFDGDATACRFLALLAGPGGCRDARLAAVEYAFDGRRLVRRETPWPAGGAGQADRLGDFAGASFSYAAAGPGETTWQAAWHDRTNAPAFVRLELAQESGRSFGRMFDRTAP
jgi:prepilin-type N-terminal cleavage/methylation domain-containing protein